MSTRCCKLLIADYRLANTPRMKLRSSIIIIACCFLLQFSNLYQKRFLFSLGNIFGKLILVFFQGLMFLIYPLLGHLADVYLTRYRSLKCGLIMVVIGGIVAFMVSVVVAIIDHTDSQVYKIGTAVAEFIIILALITGIGLFKASAIQFGMDQLLEAPTPKLIAFIQWYYWSQNLGELVVFYFQQGGHLGIIETCKITTFPQTRKWEKILATVGIFTILLTAIAALGLFSISKKKFYVQRAGLNPFKNIYKVLKYSWTHKVPQNRSAFTYWEEDIPKRIDLGKNKYGGPFTNEEVEDTKTFLRIIPLLLCLFGYQLAGDGYSAPEQLMRTSCPSLPVLVLIVANPLHVSSLVAVVGIPLYRLVIRKIHCIKRVLLLTRMWMGLYLSLLQTVLYIIVVINHDTTNWNHTVKNTENTIRNCLIVRVGYGYNRTGECVPINDPVDNTYSWLIVTQLLNGIASLLVSMTVFEFICAQAPRTTQGLLIGLWYATFSIRYLVVAILNSYISERRAWLIYEGVKGFLILVSLILFSRISQHYHYRQRDEIVNVQGMIEDIYEKRMDQEEEYMKERKQFNQNLIASNKTVPLP